MTIEALKKANEIADQLVRIEREQKSLNVIFSKSGSALSNGSCSSYVYFSSFSSETLAAVRALVETDLQRKSNALKKELEAL